MPIPIDVPAHYELAKFGRPSGVVLSARAPNSQRFEYRLAPPERGVEVWVKVALRVRIVLADRERRGVLQVTAETDGLTSASIELTPQGKSAVKWSAVWLHGGTSGSTRSRIVDVGMTNYVRTVAGRPGMHTLRFRVRRWDGFHYDHVRVRPRSGLIVTRQPPQPLRGRLAAVPPSVVVGSRFAFQGRITNDGVRMVRDLRLQTLAPPGVAPAGAVRRVGPIPPGESRAVSLPYWAEAEGTHKIQVLASSRFGQLLLEPAVTVDAPANISVADDNHGRRGLAIAAFPIGLALVGGLVAVAVVVARRRAGPDCEGPQR